MKNVLGQLTRWRWVERCIRLAWGSARWLAVVGVVLALACLLDWLADRYLGSETWRKTLKASWIFAPQVAATADERWFTEHLRLRYGLRLPPDPIVDETPRWLRVGLTGGQLLLAIGLAYVWLIRPWKQTPPIDDLASVAEKAIPEFDHRLVTAVQLNRPEARTEGMSPQLIAAVTREADELTGKHNLLALIDYRRLGYAAAVALPVLGLWAGFVAARPELASALLQRQLLLNREIPRTIHLRNVSQEVWPTGSEVEVRFHVTGAYTEDMVGRLRVEPDGQPEDYYDLTFERNLDDGSAYFVAKLPPASSDFDFTARLGNGRSRERGRIRFEAPPTTLEIEAWQILPEYLGTYNGRRYERRNDGSARGEVVDALPKSDIRVGAVFSKPVTQARLIPLERDGLDEKPSPLGEARLIGLSDDRTVAEWRFPTTEKMIGYRIELVDDRGFTNAVPIRRNIRMLENRPPTVTFLPESTRHPDPNDFESQGDPRAYEWGDSMPLTLDGRIMVIYQARSEQGIYAPPPPPDNGPLPPPDPRQPCIRYRVIPRGIPPDAYPEAIRDIQHPRDDPENKVFNRLPLKRVVADPKTLGPFIPELGLFQRSWDGLVGLRRAERMKVNVEFYAIPSPNPAYEPGELEAGGRYMFEVAELTKRLPDGRQAKLELGDTVELYVEVYDKNPDNAHRPGYTKEARRKIVVSSEEAYYALKMRDEQHKRLQDKLRELAIDQQNVFRKPDDAGKPKNP
jgi:hypothetical protein